MKKATASSFDDVDSLPLPIKKFMKLEYLLFYDESKENEAEVEHIAKVREKMLLSRHLNNRGIDDLMYEPGDLDDLEYEDIDEEEGEYYYGDEYGAEDPIYDRIYEQIQDDIQKEINEDIASGNFGLRNKENNNGKDMDYVDEDEYIENEEDYVTEEEYEDDEDS